MRIVFIETVFKIFQKQIDCFFTELINTIIFQMLYEYYWTRALKDSPAQKSKEREGYDD